jgi:hypothetical protein
VQNETIKDFPYIFKMDKEQQIKELQQFIQHGTGENLK